MRIVGIILIVLGIVGLALGGISFTSSRTVAEVGPIELTAEERETLPIPPLAAGAAVLAGIALVVVSSRRGR